MVRLRLRRIGKKGRAYYRIVAADSRAPRDGAFIEELGAYNPHADPPVANLNEERVRYWLSVGAQPSERVERLFKRRGIIEGPNDPPPGAQRGKAAAKAGVATAEAPGSVPAETATEPAEKPEPAAEAPAETPEAAAEATGQGEPAAEADEAPAAETEAPEAAAEAEETPESTEAEEA